MVVGFARAEASCLCAGDSSSKDNIPGRRVYGSSESLVCAIQYREQLAETVTRISVGQSQKRFNDRRIISRFGLIPVYRPAKTHRSACLPFTEAMLIVHEIR